MVSLETSPVLSTDGNYITLLSNRRNEGQTFSRLFIYLYDVAAGAFVPLPGMGITSRHIAAPTIP